MSKTTSTHPAASAADHSNFGQAPIRVGASSSFSRPAALVGGATALIALTAIATALVVRPAAPVGDPGAEARVAAVAAKSMLTEPASASQKVADAVDSEKPMLDDGADKPAAKAQPKPQPKATAKAPAAKPAPHTAAQANTGTASTTASSTAAAQPAPVVAAVCNTCGVIEAVTPVQQKGEGSGVGAVAGGVLGGVVGHQVGGGNGKKAMTVLGAIGGGLAGHEIEKRQRSTTVYSVKVRMEDGSLRSVTQETAPTVGQKVTLEGSQIRARG